MDIALQILSNHQKYTLCALTTVSAGTLTDNLSSCVGMFGVVTDPTGQHKRRDISPSCHHLNVGSQHCPGPFRCRYPIGGIHRYTLAQTTRRALPLLGYLQSPTQRLTEYQGRVTYSLLPGNMWGT